MSSACEIHIFFLLSVTSYQWFISYVIENFLTIENYGINQLNVTGKRVKSIKIRTTVLGLQVIKIMSVSESYDCI